MIKLSLKLKVFIITCFALCSLYMFWALRFFNFNFCTQFVLGLTVYNTAIRHLTNTNEIFNVTIIIQKG